jgi:hypothetical protein
MGSSMISYTHELRRAYGRQYVEHRFKDFVKLGLIAKNDNSIILTARGESVAALLHGLYKWIAPGESEVA